MSLRERSAVCIMICYMRGRTAHAEPKLKGFSVSFSLHAVLIPVVLDDLYLCIVIDARAFAFGIVITVSLYEQANVFM